MVARFLRYLDHDIWRIRVRDIKGPHGFLLRMVRIVVLSFREFSLSRCALWASALTFYSLLSIVPVFAMVFGVAKGFGLDHFLKQQIMRNAQGQQEVMMRIAEFSENLLKTTSGGLIAGIGLLLLFWSVIQVLSNIERAFNHIWGIRNSRSLSQKFTDYLALMLIVPVFFIAASGATIFLTSQVAMITERMNLPWHIGPWIVGSMQILPFIVFACLLTYLYVFIPNGKIKMTSALIGGVTAGAIYQIVQWGYVKFQIGAANAGAVYGTFAALPLFLVWLQIGWMIVLYGAELSFAHQNEERFEFEKDSQNASYSFKKLLALRMMQIFTRRFMQGLESLSAERTAEKMELPIRLTLEIIDMLTRADLLVVVHGEDERERYYQPGCDVSQLRVQDVIRKIENAGTAAVPLPEAAELEKMRETLRAFDVALGNLPENQFLKDLSPAGVTKITPVEIGGFLPREERLK